MSRHNYSIEYDHLPSVDEMKRDVRHIRAALHRGMIIATAPGIRIRDLGPKWPTIRLAAVERNLAR